MKKGLLFLIVLFITTMGLWAQTTFNVPSTGYPTIQDAIDEAIGGDIIQVAAGTYDLTSQMDIDEPISIIGQGTVIFNANNPAWSSVNGYKHLIGIYSGTQASPVTISNITLNCNNQCYGLNTYSNAFGILNNITISNSKGPGLTVNGSTIIATNLITNSNAWGAVNIDPGSGVSDPSVFTLNSGTLPEDNQIWSDGANVSSTATVTVNALGYDEYNMGNGKIWTNRTLTNCATITMSGVTTIYSTIQAAIDAANSGDVIEVAAGIYHETITIDKSIDLRGAQYGVDPTVSGARLNVAAESIIDLVGVPGSPSNVIHIPTGTNNAEINGFTLNGSQTVGTAINIDDQHVIVANNIMEGKICIDNNKSNKSFIANRIITYGTGIRLYSDSSTDVTISGNTISPAAGKEHGTGIYSHRFYGGIISNNLISGFSAGYGMDFTLFNDYFDIIDNTLEGNKVGIRTERQQDLNITGNTIYNSTNEGIILRGKNINLTNNLIYNNGTNGISIGDPGPAYYYTTENITFNNNSIYGNGNYGLSVDAAIINDIDATLNYWGSTTPDFSIIISSPGIATVEVCDYYTDAGLTTTSSIGCPSVTNLTQGLSYATIQAAIDAANAGDVINLSAETYSETINLLGKSLTITGAGSSQTIINANGISGYAIQNFGDNVSISDLKLINSEHYGFKASGNTNLTLTNIIVDGSAKTGIDLNGVNTATLTNIEVKNTVGGFGLMIGNSNNITVNGITTSNNPWAGVTIQSFGGTHPGGCNNITFTGAFNASDNIPFQIEKDLDGTIYHDITNVTLPSHFAYVVYGFRTGDNYKQWFYRETLVTAQTYAESLANSTSHTFEDIVVYNLAETNYYVSENINIQDAIDAASLGTIVEVEAGTYTESIVIDKHLTITGAGSDASGTIITNNAHVVTINASGISTTNPLLIADLRIEPNGVYGINIGTASFLEFDNVHVIGSSPAFIENEVGLKISTTSNVDNLVVNNCAFNNCDHGWYIAKHGDWGPGASNFTNVVVSNTEFLINDYKGLYIEKLSDAIFDNCTVNDNGSLANWNNDWNGGMDINLKGEEAYVNIQIVNSEFANNGLGYKEGAGLLVKARDDGTTYGAHPATLNNVIITNCTVTGNERGIRLGEPTKGNATPTNVSISDCKITANVQTYSGSDGSAYGGVINYTSNASPVDASCNWWGTSDSYAIPAFIYGDVKFLSHSTAANPMNCDGVGPVTNITQGTSYLTIQAAIDDAAAGEVIEVASGSYTENIEIDVPNLTLQSAAGRDFTTIENPNVGSETGAISVLANMGVVTVDGFTVNNFRNGIIQSMSQATGTAYIVKNSKVIPENYGTDPYLRNGIQVSGGGSQIINNYIVGAPLTTSWNSTGLHVVNASNVLVQGNTVNTNSTTGMGIGITNWNTSLVQNITIENNTLTGKTGIGISGPSGTAYNVKDVVITNNIIHDNTYAGINIQTISLENLDVNNNQISNNLRGIRFSNSATVAGVINVNHNSITNSTDFNLGNFSSYTEIDASCNWWGVTDVYNIASAIIGDVQFLPFSTAANPTNCDGVGPVVNLTQGTSYMTIQAAIDDAVADDELHIAAGSFAEQINIDKTLIIKGNNTGLSAGSTPVTRTTETVIDGGFYLHVGAPDCIIDGLTIENGYTSGSHQTGIVVGAPGLEISNCILKNCIGSQAQAIETVGAAADDLLVENCEVTGNWRGMYLNPADGISLIGNKIHANNGVGVGIGSDGQSNLTITNNYIYDHTLEGWGAGTVGSNVIATSNQLYNNGTSVAHYGGQQINATCNWWGVSDAYDITAEISGDVQFLPFSTAANPTNCDGVGPVANITKGTSYMTIQTAIDDAVAGNIINVSAGIYREQLYIDKSLELIGAGELTTTIEAPDLVDRSAYTVTQWTGTNRTIDAVIGVSDAGAVNISGFRVDGRDTGADNFYGIHYFNTGGIISENTIDGITYPASPGAQRVLSLVATHGVNQTFDIDVIDNYIPGFQKGGIALMGPGCTFTVNENHVIGSSTPSIAGNCIQLSYGATGTTYQNIAEGVIYTGSGWSSTGILLFESGDISMDGDEVLNCQSGVNFSDWGWVYIAASTVNLTFENLNLHNNEWTLGTQLSRDGSDVNVVITDCNIVDNGGDAIDLWGSSSDPWGGSYYTGWENGSLTATITGTNIANSVYDGIWIDDLSGNNNSISVIVNNCSFSGNANYAVNNQATQLVNATNNYWDGCPSVSGDVDYYPYYTSITGTPGAYTFDGSITNIEATSSGPVCEGLRAVLTASNGSSFSWDNGLGLGALKSVRPHITTTYTVTGTDLNSCTGAEASVEVIVIPRPEIKINGEIAGTTTIAQGTSLTLTASGGTTYQWIPGNATADNISVSPNNSRRYWVIGDPDGCWNYTHHDVEVISVDAGYNQFICEGESVTLTAVCNGFTPSGYLWSNSETSQSITVAPVVTTTYTVSADGTTDNVTVYVNPKPTADAGSDIVIASGGSGMLLGNASGGTPPYSYAWTGDLFTQDITVTSDGTYTITVTDGNGCQGVDDAVVTVAASGVTVSGNISYAYGTINEQMHDVEITLTGTGASAGTNYTTNSASTGDGNYEFIGVADGNYVMSLNSPKPWGGVEFGDLYAIVYHFYAENFAYPFPLISNSIKKRAADVNNDNSITLDDYYIVYDRINGDPMATGDWVFMTETDYDNTTIPYANNLETSTNKISLNVAGGDITGLNFKALCYGDVDASNTGMKNNANSTAIQFVDLSEKYGLMMKNYPNPFSHSTTISYLLPIDSKVSIEVYNLMGQKVDDILVNSMQQSGVQMIEYRNPKLVEGIYILKLESSSDSNLSFRQSSKMIIAR